MKDFIRGFIRRNVLQLSFKDFFQVFLMEKSLQPVFKNFVYAFIMQKVLHVDLKDFILVLLSQNVLLKAMKDISTKKISYLIKFIREKLAKIYKFALILHPPVAPFINPIRIHTKNYLPYVS